LALRDSHAAADEFISEQMRTRPTLRGLLALLSTHREPAAADQAMLQSLLQKLVLSKPAYQCHRCGFSGRQIHWLCPSCKQWNTVLPIGGAEGD
jgi:lipopolysaccharide biosynthesis regulator YciM